MMSTFAKFATKDRMIREGLNELDEERRETKALEAQFDALNALRELEYVIDVEHGLDFSGEEVLPLHQHYQRLLDAKENGYHVSFECYRERVRAELAAALAIDPDLGGPLLAAQDWAAELRMQLIQSYVDEGTRTVD